MTRRPDAQPDEWPAIKVELARILSRGWLRVLINQKQLDVRRASSLHVTRELESRSLNLEK